MLKKSCLENSKNTLLAKTTYLRRLNKSIMMDYGLTKSALSIN